MTLPAALAGEPTDSSGLASGLKIGAIPMVLTGTYDPYLVALSVLVASFASYTALGLSGHVGTAQGLARRVWLVAAAITMGGGIWSMHFIGMLAFVMPIPMSYDIRLTTLSLLVAIFVTGGGFYVISLQSASPLCARPPRGRGRYPQPPTLDGAPPQPATPAAALSGSSWASCEAATAGRAGSRCRRSCLSRHVCNAPSSPICHDPAAPG